VLGGKGDAMSLIAKLMVVGTAALLLPSCSMDSGIDITAPLIGSTEQPTIAEAHASLQRAAENKCPSGYEFDSSSITYSVRQQDTPATVTMRVRCKWLLPNNSFKPTSLRDAA
jgi:hypothetical protein